MKGIAVDLPEIVRQKLVDLQLACGVAEDAARAATNRLNMLPQIGADDMRARLSAEQQKQQNRFAKLHQLVNRLQQFLAELPRHIVLQPAPTPEVELKPGETLDSALGNLRTLIASTKQHLQSVRTAPLPAADAKKLAAQYVVQKALAGRPNVAIVADQLRVTPRGDVFSVEDTLALIAWAAPEALCEILEREIDELPTRADAMPRAERLQRSSELEKTLLDLEFKEEALITRAHGDGLEILRRPEADPRAVLGVAIAKAAQAA